MSPAPTSLLTMSVRKVVEHLHLYSGHNYEDLNFLPLNLKNKILKRFMSRQQLWNKVDFAAVLAAILNKETDHINLTYVVLNDNILKALEKCYTLTALHLSGSEESIVSTEGLVTLLSQLHMLTDLVINNCYAVNDRVLGCIAKNCPQLLVLDVGGCENVTNAGVVELVKLKNLSCIKLSKTQVSDEGIKELVKEGGQRIKELGMHDCLNITQVALEAISNCCPNIEILSLYGSGYHRDVAGFEANFKNLRLLMWSIKL